MRNNRLSFRSFIPVLLLAITLSSCSTGAFVSESNPDFDFDLPSSLEEQISSSHFDGETDLPPRVFDRAFIGYAHAFPNRFAVALP